MPKLKRRKDGGYYTHATGDNNPVNTFQTTDRGAEIVKSSGRQLGEYFPDQLFFLLLDLGHLSTKDGEHPDEKFEGSGLVDEVYEELSIEDRVDVAVQVVETHGVEELYTGKPAKWVFSLLDQSTTTLKPLTKVIAEASGYSFITCLEYSELVHDNQKSLEIALSGYLQIQWLRESTSFEDNNGDERERSVLGVDGDFVYLKTSDKDTRVFGIPGEMPGEIAEELEAELDKVWSKGKGVAGFAALTSMEVEYRYDVENGITLPKSRLEDFPVELPPRSELTELYEALRVLNSTVETVLSSEASNVEHGDGSACEQWYEEIQSRLNDKQGNGVEGLGSQQGTRTDSTVQTYRDCYGDGERITEYACIEVTQPPESEQLRLFGFGIFDHSETVRVPVAPDSGTPLSVYPKTKNELEDAVELLSEFPSKPSSGALGAN